jgi:hypothetical protein
VISELSSRFVRIWGQGTTPVHHVEVVPPVLGVFTEPDLMVVGVALVGGVGLLVRAFDRDRSLRPPAPAPRMWAMLLLLLAVMSGAITYRHSYVWDHVRDASYSRPATNTLTPGVISYFHEHTAHPFPVVMATYTQPPTDGVSYQLVGRDTVYTVALLEPHTRATPKDYPRARRRTVNIFFATGLSEAKRDALMARLNVSYVLYSVKTQSAAVLAKLRADPTLRQVYEDPPSVNKRTGRYVIFQRLGARKS